MKDASASLSTLPRAASGRFARFVVEQVWLWGVVVLAGLFIGMVALMNRWNLAGWGYPRLVQALLSAAILAVLVGGGYWLGRSTFVPARKDLEALYQLKLLFRQARKVMSRLEKKGKSERAAAIRAIVVQADKALRGRPDPAALLVWAKGLIPEASQEKETRSGLFEYIGSVGIALLVAVLVRGFLVGNFVIPSGSMLPTLQLGDHLFVNQLIYGVGIPFTNIKFGTHIRPPRRGEVIVFGETKADSWRDLIKRVVAVPGDEVRLCTGRDDIWINGSLLPHQIDPAAATSATCFYDDNQTESRQIEKWERHACRYALWEENGSQRYRIQKTDDPGAVQAGHTFVAEQFQKESGQEACYRYPIPDDHVFVMGDNRDHSADGRIWGLVPYGNIKGKAMFVWWSEGVRWEGVHAQPYARFDRIFRPIHGGER